MTRSTTFALLLLGPFTLACEAQPPASASLSYSPAAGSPIEVGPMAGRPVVGDMNGDGKLDVIVACGTCCGSPAHPESGHVAVLLNDGAGKLTHDKALCVKIGPSARKIAVGDVNGDGKPDVVVAEHDTYGVTALLNNGLGKLTPGPGSPFLASNGSRPHTHEIALADVNGDGHLDVLTTNANDNTISVLLGDGKAAFAPAQGSPFETGRHPYDALAVQDLNGDGKVDVVVPLTGGNKIGVLFGDGAGAFAHAPDSRYPVGERPGYIAVGDLNGDGKADIIATHDDVGMIDVLLNDGNGKFAPAGSSPVKLDTAVWGIAIGDLNRDGRNDLALGGMTGSQAVLLLGDGRGGFGSPPIVVQTGGDSPNYIAIADLNADGTADLITGNYGSGNVSVLLGK